MDTTKNTATTNPNAGQFSYYPDRTGQDGKQHLGVSQQIPTTTNCGQLYLFITKRTTYSQLEQRTLTYRQARSEQWTTEEERKAIEAKARAIKEALPTFRATGIFKYIKAADRQAGENAQQIQHSSNLICLDFDHITDIAAAWQRLIDDAVLQPVLLFHSVSGHGIKGIFPFPEYKDKEQWKLHCRAIADHFKDITSTDKDTGEITPAIDFDNANTLQHANSFCIDESAYYNPTADPANPQCNHEAFAAAIAYTEKRAAEIKAAEPEPQPRTVTHTAPPTAAPNGRTYTAEELADYSLRKVSWYADRLQAMGKDITKGVINWRIVGFALSDGILPTAEAEAIFCKVSAQHPDYDETKCKDFFTKATKERNGSVNLGTFFARAAEAIGETYEQHNAAFKKPKPPTQQPMATLSTLSTMDTVATQAEVDTIATMDRQATMANDDAAATIPAPIQETITTQQTMDTTATQTFKQTTLADLKAEAANATPSIPTAFAFGGEPLTLRSSALTLIAAKSSHGKTRLLENMAYYTATHDTDKQEAATILFTLEEPKKHIFEHLTAIHANTKGERYTIQEIETALHQTSNGEEANEEHQQALQSFDEALKRHHLYLFDDMDTPTNPNPRTQDNTKWDYTTVQAICNDMRTFAQQRPIKAIYIDHLQMLQYYGEGTRTGKNERIELILSELERLAKELQIPVVITAQMNRSTYNGLNMTGSNIAESADTERSADTVLLIWNSSFPFTNTQNEPTGDDVVASKNYSDDLAKIGYHYTGEDDEQMLLAVLYKRRGSRRGRRTTFAYHAPFGSIIQTDIAKATGHAQESKKKLSKMNDGAVQSKLNEIV